MDTQDFDSWLTLLGDITTDCILPTPADESASVPESIGDQMRQQYTHTQNLYTVVNVSIQQRPGTWAPTAPALSNQTPVAQPGQAAQSVQTVADLSVSVQTVAEHNSNGMFRNFT